MAWDNLTKPNNDIPMINIARFSHTSAIVLYKFLTICFDLLSILGRVYLEQIIPQNRIETIPENSKLFELIVNFNKCKY